MAELANILNAIAQRMEDNLEALAAAETWDNGKPIRETRAADIPLAIDHFRYFAGCIRAQEGSLGEIDGDTLAYHSHNRWELSPNHTLEFPDSHSRLEAGAGLGCGELRGNQTR